MAIAILATGDELIQGDTLNTNTQAIAHALHSEGLSLGIQMSCRDKEGDIMDGLTFLSQNHDIIILTGGLGPTTDDRTRFALGRFLDTPLIEFSEALEHIQARLVKANLKMNAGNHQQTLFPPNAILLPNPNGTAMGCYCSENHKIFILLPGPPRECIPMFMTHVIPLIQNTEHHNQQLLKWRLFGVAEGEIAEVLESALEGVHCETGYRLETPYLEFKVRCDPIDAPRIKQMIDPLVLPHFIAPPEQKASERLCLMIEHLQKSMVIIDDVTGGVLQRLIHRPCNYHWLKFHDTASSPQLYFHLSGLEEYWKEQAQASVTHLTIKYHNDTEHVSESHQIPFRSSLVIEYAAEWLCFRMLHLIDQLHQ